MRVQAQMKQFQIAVFQDCHQQAVEDLVLPIQQLEFGVPISRNEQADLVDIKGVFQKGNGNFWVALSDDEVIGTVGIVDIGNNEAALKKMFVHRAHRGKQPSVAAHLINCVKQWSREHGIKRIFLGTTEPMQAAHRFYEKNGFIQIALSELPNSFPIVHVDTKFYQQVLDLD